jgi:hypothetical protein
MIVQFLLSVFLSQFNVTFQKLLLLLKVGVASQTIIYRYVFGRPVLKALVLEAVLGSLFGHHIFRGHHKARFQRVVSNLCLSSRFIQ